MNVQFYKLEQVNSNFKNLSKEQLSPRIKNISFEAATCDAKKPDGKTKVIDKVLNNKAVKWLFKIANKNPFAFTIAALLATCVVMRPATIMITPGSDIEDKKYAAGKSIIASIIANASRLVFILPLGIVIHKLGQKALDNPEFKFPKLKTKEFDSFKYLVTNAAGLALSLALSALIVKFVAVIMKELVPEKKTGGQNGN